MPGTRKGRTMCIPCLMFFPSTVPAPLYRSPAISAKRNVTGGYSSSPPLMQVLLGDSLKSSLRVAFQFAQLLCQRFRRTALAGTPQVWVSNCVGCGDESNLTVVAAAAPDRRIESIGAVRRPLGAGPAVHSSPGSVETGFARSPTLLHFAKGG